MTAEEMKKKGLYLADPMNGAPLPMQRLARALQGVDLGEKHAAPGRAAVFGNAPEETMPQMPAAPDTINHPPSTIHHQPSTINQVDIKGLFASLPSADPVTPVSRRRRRRRPASAAPETTPETLPAPAAEPAPVIPDRETPPVIDPAEKPANMLPSNADLTPATTPIGEDPNKAAFAWEKPAEANPLPADEQDKAAFAWENPTKPKQTKQETKDWRAYFPHKLTPEPYTKKGGQPYASYFKKHTKLLDILYANVKDPEILNAAKMAFDPKSAGVVASLDSLNEVVRGAMAAQKERDRWDRQTRGGQGAQTPVTHLDPKAEAVFEKSLEEQAKQISDPQVRMEAFRVALDQSMAPEDRQKAFASYLSSFPKQAVGQRSKAERYMAKIDELESVPNPTGRQKRRLEQYRALLAKEQAVAMSDLSKKQKDLAKIKTSFVDTLPPAVQGMALSEIDTRKLTPAQQAQAAKVGAWAVKAMGLKNATFDKDIANITTQMRQASNAMLYTMKALAGGKEFNALNRKKRDLVSDYTGLSGDDLARAFRDKQAMSLFSKYRHGLYGGQLSKTEKPEFEREASTLYRSNSDIGLAIQSIMSNNLARLDGIRTVMTPEVFNLKYGALYRNLKEFNDANARALKLAMVQGERKRRIRIIPQTPQPDRVPQATQPTQPPQTQARQTTAPYPVAKKHLSDGRIAVKYSDGSIQYYAQ